MDAIAEALNGTIDPSKLTPLPAYNDLLSPETLLTFSETLKEHLSADNLRPFKLSESFSKSIDSLKYPDTDTRQALADLNDLNRHLLKSPNQCPSLPEPGCRQDFQDPLPYQFSPSGRLPPSHSHPVQRHAQPLPPSTPNGSWSSHSQSPSGPTSTQDSLNPSLIHPKQVRKQD